MRRHLLGAAFSEMYAKQNWGTLVQALGLAKNNHDGSGIRQLLDEDWYGRDPETGEFDPINDRYFLLGAIEQKYRKGDVDSYLEAGQDCWEKLFPVRAHDVFRGPFHVPQSAATPLVVDTTYDPATPYRGGQILARDLGNARLLTMRGDGHTAYGLGSPDCIDPAVEAYLINRVLAPAGTKCNQEVPFLKLEDALAKRQAPAQIKVRPHTRPLAR